MQLDFVNYGPSSYDEYESLFLALVDKTFNEIGVKEDYYIDVSIVDNVKIQKINKTYRGIDRPTDVISFAFYDDENEVINEDAPNSLGSIIISYQKAEEQAKEYEHSLKREMSFLFVHGLLHLLGYDHMEKADEEIMFALQNKILGERKDG